MNTEEIKSKLQNLVGLSVVVARDFANHLINDEVSFSIRGNLEYFKIADYYRLNVTTVNFVSFKAEDVDYITDSRIELK